MRRGHGSQGGWALRALAVTHPSPGSVGATGERRGPTAIPCSSEDRLPLRDPRGCRCPPLPWPHWAGASFSSSLQPEPTPLSSVPWRPTPPGCQAGAHSTVGVLGPRGSQQDEQYTAPQAGPQGLGVPSHSRHGQAGHQAGCGTRSHRGDNRNKYGEGVAWARPQHGARACPQPQPPAQPRSSPEGCWPVMEMVASPWSCRRRRWRVTVQGEARARTSMSMVGAARGARAQAGASTRPGPLAAAPPARRPLAGRSPPRGKRGSRWHRVGTGGHSNLHWPWHEGLGKAQPTAGTP